MLKPTVQSLPVKKFKNNNLQIADDLLTVEEPLEIRLSFGSNGSRKQKSISVTMRTPGHDFELALGFLYTEAVVHDKNEILGIRYCEKEQGRPGDQNLVLVELHEKVIPDVEKLERNFYTTSGCGSSTVSKSSAI